MGNCPGGCAEDVAEAQKIRRAQIQEWQAKQVAWDLEQRALRSGASATLAPVVFDNVQEIGAPVEEPIEAPTNEEPGTPTEEAPNANTPTEPDESETPAPPKRTSKTPAKAKEPAVSTDD